ncbi:MAG: CoA transferase [Dethiobacter sp.]|jgi:CoA:oxalate CoA-transferase|nr:CoA transferase [Dethiobacter sp.]
MILDGIVVLDLTKVLAGPFCAMQLADFGAEVIKIENPHTGGDDARQIGPHVNGESAYFMSINRNKKSVTLNLKTAGGREIFKKMVARADVVLENYRFGVMEELGLGYEELSKINPRLIYASCSGFGHSGPYRSRPAYDVVIQAMGGIMSVTGEKGGSPTRVGVSIGDLAAGLYLAFGIILALLHREKAGHGQKVDVAMLDCQIALLENHIARHLVSGDVPEPIGNRHASLSPFGSFKTKDGYIVIAAGNNKLWSGLCHTLGVPELIEDPRFATNVQRVENYTELEPLLQKQLKVKTSTEWVETLTEAGIPCGPINTVPDIINDPQVKAREMIVDVESPAAGTVGLAGIPIKFSLSPGSVRKAAPVLGEDNTEVLKNFLGLSQQEIDELKINGTI